MDPVSTSGGTGAVDIAALSTQLQSTETAVKAEVAVLKDALEMEGQAVSQLLASMGLGQNIDVTV